MERTQKRFIQARTADSRRSGEEAFHSMMAGQHGGRQCVTAAGLGGIEGALAEDGFAAGYFRRGDGYPRVWPVLGAR